MEKEILFKGPGVETKDRADSGHERTSPIDELRTIWKILCEVKRENGKDEIDALTKRFLRW